MKPRTLTLGSEPLGGSDVGRFTFWFQLVLNYVSMIAYWPPNFALNRSTQDTASEDEDDSSSEKACYLFEHFKLLHIQQAFTS